MRIEARLLYRPIGLVDDIVVFATAAEYLALASEVAAAAESTTAKVLSTASEMPIELVRALDPSPGEISIDVQKEDARSELFTYLDDADDQRIPDLDRWLHERNILRVRGNAEILTLLSEFLVDLSGRGPGYSYLAEFTSPSRYSTESPEWRLHVEEAR